MPKGLGKSHAQAVKDFASQNGFEYAAKFGRKALGVTAKLDAMDDWTEGHNLVRGTLGGTDFQMFDMAKVVRGHDADGHATESTVTQTVVMFENSRDLQPFSMMEIAGIFSLMGFAGAMGVALEVDEGLPEERELVAKMNKRYMITGTSFEAGMELRETPDCVNLALLQLLQSARGWSVEVGKSHIALLVRSKVLPAEDRSTCLAESIEILNAMHAPAQGRSKLWVRNQKPMGLSGLIGKMIWIFGGAMVGMIATGVIVGSIASATEDTPTWVVFLVPILGMPLMIAGVWAGLKLSTKFKKKG